MSLLVILKSLFFLIAILLLIYLIYIIKRQHSHLKEKSCKKINVIEQKYIDQKTMVTLLKIENRKFILATNQSALFFREFPSSLEKEELNGCATFIQKEIH